MPSSEMNLPVKNMIGAACAFILVTFLAYYPALNNGYVWDDDFYVTNNECLRTADGLKRIWFDIEAEPQYYPVTHTSFWLEYRLWRLSPAGYHFNNVLLHALSVFLLWLILRNLRIPGAWLGAMIFALHPVHVESVAWITERKNVLSGFFYLSAMLFYIRFAGLHISPSNRLPSLNIDHLQPERHKHNWKRYAFSLILYVCALLSKTVTCSMPAVLVLLIWWKRDRVKGRDILFLVPFFVLGLALALATAWIEKYQLGAQGEEWALSIVDRFLVAGRALWFYVEKLLWPKDLTFIYTRWDIDSSLWWQYLFPLAAAAGIVALWALRRRIGKGPLVAVLIFSGTLLPALGFVNVYPHRFSFVADHFQYLASIGLIVLFAATSTFLFSSLRPLMQKLGITAAVLLLIIFGLGTWRQVHAYKDQETLWTDTLSKNPRCWMAHHNLGNIRLDQGRLNEAVAHYSEAIRIKPDFDFAHYNMGTILEKQGKIEEALGHYYEVLRIDPDYSTIDPRVRPEVVAMAHNNIGHILERWGKSKEAIQHYSEAIKRNPNYAKAYNNRGAALAREGRLEEAIENYSRAISIQPDFAQAHNNMGVALAIQGRLKEAIRYFDEALRIKPHYQNAYNNLKAAKSELKAPDQVGQENQ